MKELDTRWLKNSLSARKEEVQVDLFKAPKTRIASAILEFYAQINDVVEPSHYDVWARVIYNTYSQKWRLINTFIELTTHLGVLEEGTYDSERGLQQLCFLIATKVINQREATKAEIKQFINLKWNLITTMRKIKDITITDQLVEEEKESIRRAKETTIQKMAKILNKIVFIGADIWELILYSTLSPNAPDVIINGLAERGNIHTMLIGEISTAKSKILNILKLIAPHWVYITKTTEASFEGISKMTEVSQGIIDEAKDGIILVPEFKRVFSKFVLFREFLDCKPIAISKRGITKLTDVNTSFICAANPKKDFFDVAGVMREQIPFEEGVISRFDLFIPFVLNVEKNKEITEKLDLFGGSVNIDDIEKIHLYLRTWSEGMRLIKRVEKPTLQQIQRLKEAYLKHNYVLGNRTVVIPRDLETLCRLVNIITTANFYNREEIEKGLIRVTDLDIDRAIQLWEHLIYMRTQLYQNRLEKDVLSPCDAIIKTILEMRGEVTTTKVKTEIIALGICGERTFWTHLNTLEDLGKIVRIKKNHKTIIETRLPNAECNLTPENGK